MILMTKVFIKMLHDNKDNFWKNIILEHLKCRNKMERDMFLNLVASYNKMHDDQIQLKEENLKLAIKLDKTQEENFKLMGCNSIDRFGKINLLESKIFKLQEELTDLHRKKSENSQLVMDLNAQLKSKTQELEKLKINLNDTNKQNECLQSQVYDYEQKIHELGKALQEVKDEFQALQIVFTTLEEKYQKLQLENAELVSRWLEVRQRDADKLNDENESIRRKGQQHLQQLLEDAANEFIKVSDECTSLNNIPYPVIVTPSFPRKVLHCIYIYENKIKYNLEKEAHENEIHACKWSPSGTILATAGGDRKIKFWEINPESFKCRCTLTGSNQAVMCLDFDEQESLILGASMDFASRIWSVGDQRLRHTFTGHGAKVLVAKFWTGESNKIVSGSYDRTIKIWDLRTRSFEVNGFQTAKLFYLIRSKETGVRTLFIGSSCNDLVTTNSVIISGHYDKILRLWDQRVDRKTSEISLPGKITSLALSKEKNELLICVRDDSLKLLDLRTNDIISTYSACGFQVACDWSRAAFSPDQKYIASGSLNKGVYIWNKSNCQLEDTLMKHEYPVISCAWNPSGNYLASTDRSKTTVIWTNQ